MFDAVPSEFTRRCWHQARKYFEPFERSGRRAPRLTRTDLASALKRDPQWGGKGEKCSATEIDRERKRCAKAGHPDWFPWPFKMFMLPPFETGGVTLKPLDAPADAPGGGLRVSPPPGCEVEAVREAGSIILKIVPKIIPAVVAMVGSVAVFDGADGRYDGIIHWCHVLASHFVLRG
jgi:hypothetical protein